MGSPKRKNHVSGKIKEKEEVRRSRETGLLSLGGCRIVMVVREKLWLEMFQ